MIILGINDFHHDLSAAIIEDSKIIASAEEERFTRVKHQGAEHFRKYPTNSIEFCLKKAGIKLEDIDLVALGWNVTPANSFKKEKVINYLRSITKRTNQSNTRLRSTAKTIVDSLLIQRKRKYYESLGKKTIFIPHHRAHAASAFRCSGFNDANITVIDQSGEIESTSLFIGKGDEIEKIRTFPITQSIGELYTTITLLLNLGHFGEGKTMGLAPYGRVDDRFKQMMVTLKDDYKINWETITTYQQYASQGKITKDHCNIAATLQYCLEQVALMLKDHLYSLTGYKNLCLAGGVTLNCTTNGILLQSENVENIYIQPAANDGGVALGAALEAYAQTGNTCKLHMNHPYFGPSYSQEEIESILKELKLTYEYHQDIEGLTAELLAKGKLIGWFQGAMELGPRALGNRSILADPRDPKAKDRINQFVKHREMWRPLAPSMLREKMHNYVDNPYDSPFMILNFEIKPEKRAEIPSVVHVDGTARIQTVTPDTNPKFHKLLKSFEKITRVPVLLNTSFNDNHEPIIMTPKDALRTFYSTGLDCLVLGNFLLKKK